MTLTVWLKAGHTVEVIQRSAAAFYEATGVDVNLSVIPEGSAHDALVTGESRPDVVTVPYWYLDELLDKNVLCPLDELLPANGVAWQEFVSVAVDALSRGGLHWAVPHTLTGGVLSFRKDLFESAGLESPKTLDDVTRAARLLGTSATPSYGLVARASAEFSSLETYAGWAWARGIRVLPESGNPDPATVGKGVSDLVEVLRETAPPKLSLRSYAQVGELVAQGRAAQLFDTSAWAFFFENPQLSTVAGRMGYTTIRGPSAPAQFLYAEGLGITSWSRYPEEAAAFIAWRHSDRIIRAEAEDLGRFDLPRADLWATDWYRDAVARRSLEAYLEVVRRSWEEADCAHFVARADFVPAARAVMRAIAGVVDRRFADLTVAIAGQYGQDVRE